MILIHTNNGTITEENGHTFIVKDKWVCIYDNDDKLIAVYFNSNIIGVTNKEDE